MINYVKALLNSAQIFFNPDFQRPSPKSFIFGQTFVLVYLQVITFSNLKFFCSGTIFLETSLALFAKTTTFSRVVNFFLVKFPHYTVQICGITTFGRILFNIDCIFLNYLLLNTNMHFIDLNHV